MRQPLDELLAHPGVAGGGGDVYRLARENFEQQTARLTGEFQRQQRRYKAGMIRFLLEARPLVVLTSPVVYLVWIPFLLMDLFVRPRPIRRSAFRCSALPRCAAPTT